MASVLEVAHSFAIGGSERVAAQIAVALAEAGHDAGFLGLYGGNGRLMDELQSRGVRCLRLELGRLPWPKRLFRPFVVYWRLRKLRVDVIHVHHVAFLRDIYWPARLAGVRRIVLSEHNVNMMKDLPGYRRTAMTYGKRVERVTGIHQGIGDYFAGELGIEPSRIEVIPNGVDGQKFAPAPASERGRRGEVVIGWVGRFEADKNPQRMIRIAHKLSKLAPGPFRIVMVGDGAQRAATEQLAEELEVGHLVEFAGASDEVSVLLKSFDVFVLTSDTEGTPLALLEAMATGLPCIATAVGSIPQVISTDCGTTVASNDEDGFAAALAGLVSEPERRRDQGRHARDRAVTEFSLDRMLDSYRRVLVG